MIRSTLGFVGDRRASRDSGRHGDLWRVGYFVSACVAVLAALFLERAAFASGIGLISWIPLSSFAVIWLLERISLHPRFFLAFGWGIFLDALSGYPFGAHLVPLLIVAGAVGFFHMIFSSQESFAVRLGMIALLCGIFLLLLLVTRNVFL